MLETYFQLMNRILFRGSFLISTMAVTTFSYAQSPSCDWDNSKEFKENGQFDGESENWKDLVRENPHARYDIYTNYLQGGTYPTGTQHLIGIDFAEDNLGILTERYEATVAYAKSVCDRELHDLAGYKYSQTLVESGHYSTLLNFINSLPQHVISESDKAKIELRAKYKTSSQHSSNEPVKLKNLSSRAFPNSLTIKAKANNRSSRLIFDTGGNSTSYGYKFGKKAKFHISEFEDQSRTSNSRTYTSKLGFIDRLKLGPVSLENVHVNLTPFKPNEFWFDGKNKENFDGILGFNEIKKLGERIRFIVKNNRVDHIIIDDLPPDATAIEENQDIETKIFLGHQASKPFINLKIGDQSYACLWDTGWDVTTISEAIYAKHSDVITRKDFAQSGKVHGRLNQAMVAGTSLPHDIRFRDRKTPWCVIGLNAIIAAGGAVWDVKNGRIELGP